MTDNAFLFHVLEDGKWHGQNEILERSMRERGCGLTVHSRAADLRKRGCVVENQLRRTGTGRASSYYRMVALEETSASPDSVRDGTDGSTVVSSSAPSNRARPEFQPSFSGPPSSEPQNPTQPDGGVLTLWFDEHDQAHLYGDAA